MHKLIILSRSRRELSPYTMSKRVNLWRFAKLKYTRTALFSVEIDNDFALMLEAMHSEKGLF